MRGAVEDERVKAKEQEHQRKKWEGKRWEERGEGWRVRGMSPLSRLSHTDVWGGGEEQEEDWGENREAEKVKETTSEGETKKGERKITQKRSGDRAWDKGWRISTIQEEDRENKALKEKHA